MTSGRRGWGEAKILFVLLWIVLSCAAAFAHPMGNFSINHYAKITVGQKSIEIRYLIDMAEIPTYQEIRQFGMVPKAEDQTVSRYLDLQESILRAGLALEIDGRRIPLNELSRKATFADGAGGLPTMKVEFMYQAPIDQVGAYHRILYSDSNFPGRAGWKEIVTLGSADATIQSSSAAVTDRSNGLTNYSSDALNSPPQQLSASFDSISVVEPKKNDLASAVLLPHLPLRKERPIAHGRSEKQAAPGRTLRPIQSPARLTSHEQVGVDRAALVPVPETQTTRQQNTPRSRFTELISSQSKLSLWFLLSAALISAGLGALHALEPGHGKTIVAAYLVGSRGTARHAILLGIVVASAHTAGVFLLGGVTLYASRYIVPEQLYPWLGAISGLSVAGLGAFTLLRHITGQSGDHSHVSGEQHSHWFLSMFKKGAPALSGPGSVTKEKVQERALSLRELCMLGITGGIVPCPAALVVLLSAFSLHRIGFGLFLISAFSVGLAAVLVVIGLTMVYTKRLVAARVKYAGAALRYLPAISSILMVTLGFAIAWSSIGSLHFTQSLVSKDKLVPFVTVVLLGLFLGMRHSTDSDHVVAVSTIVSRQGSIRSSATVGLLWGLGHTLTIFFVGSAIIIFGVVIPARLGLSMEFCVALMLILLGTLNLSGMMSRITNRFTPEASGVNFGEDGIRNSFETSTKRRFFEKIVGSLGLYQTVRPFVVGLVHGLAGSAAVALLVLSTIKSPLWSTLYLLVFGLGTMIGMMLMTAAISMPVVYANKKFFNMNRNLTVVSGFASVAFGTFLVYQIGFVDGLFRSHVHWIPQ